MYSKSPHSHESFKSSPKNNPGRASLGFESNAIVGALPAFCQPTWKPECHDCYDLINKLQPHNIWCCVKLFLLICKPHCRPLLRCRYDDNFKCTELYSGVGSCCWIEGLKKEVTIWMRIINAWSRETLFGLIFHLWITSSCSISPSTLTSCILSLSKAVVAALGPLPLAGW